MELNEIMKNTADAIREKKGTTDLIAPVDFASEIKSISTGGGADLEGEYYLTSPNGWYWRCEKDELREGNDEVIQFIKSGLYSAVVNGELLNVPRANSYISAAYVLKDYSGVQGFAENKILFEFEGMKFNSFAEMVYLSEEAATMEEAEEIAEEYYGLFGLQRITKEEYESLIINA